MLNEKNVFPKGDLMKEKGNVVIILLLLLLTIGIGYLCYVEYKDKQIQPYVPPHGVLVLYSDSDSPSYSDSTQVDNALSYGGEIHMDISSSDTITESFGSLNWQRSGASNSDDRFYLRGAVLNYIASHNWTLVQAPSTGISKTYYFVR